MNETGMSSAEWHKFNRHLKSLITEGMVSIERKGIEIKRIRDFTRFMVTNNQDAPLKIDIGDSRVVCFDVSSRYRGNTAYFKRLGNVLNHLNAPGVVMKYLLSRDLSDFEPQEIPATKMKEEIMRDQLPNPIRFLIYYLASWSEGKKFSQIGIDQTHLQINGKRKYHYILDRPKIVAKLRESDLGDMEEFFDIPQPETLKSDDLPENETTDIPIFNAPETIPQKIIPPQPERYNRVADRKNKPSPNTSKDKKASNQDDLTQAVFDYVTEDTRALVTSTSGTSDTSKRPEPVIDKPETIELLESNKPISKNTNTPSKETNVKPDLSKPNSNELSSAILLSRAQREERLRKKAVELGEDPDVFMTITKKDRLDSITFRDRMETDSRMCNWAEETEENPKEYMDMTVRERLIGEEIIRRSLEDEGVTSSWLDTDEKWKKTISILQENEQFLEKYNLSTESSPERLSEHNKELDASFKEKKEALLPDKRKEKLTIEKRAEYCAKAVKAGVEPKIIDTYARDPALIQQSNKIQKDTHSEQGVILSTEKIAQLNAEVRNTVFSIIEELTKQLEDCHPKYNTLEKRVKRLERNVKFLKTETEDLDECVDRETVIDLIHKIVLSLINEKSKGSAYSSESSEESDSDDTHVIRKRKDVAYALTPLVKQGRRIRPRKVKRVVFLER
ncbi:hypothetical protein GLOIN_2v1877063 [Rhizophagus clarus]|uniref:NrS-1 polymerase-like helicase domain-containing protein n=1 Tax=Rhizophagus clarus TaxID=94130 RepID=A0A8H3KVT3_9GLOM|nr:hypothetical protein GLOIN_2v1877063 [Rhizophagus clarus]